MVIRLVFSLLILFFTKPSFGGNQSLFGWQINWQKEVQNKCPQIWPIKSFSQLNNTVPPEFLCQCALANNDLAQAKKYLDLGSKDASSSSIMNIVLSARIEAASGSDENAVNAVEKALVAGPLYFLFRYPELKALADRNAKAANYRYELQPSFDLFNIFITLICLMGTMLLPLLFIIGKKQKPHFWLLPIVINFSLIMFSFVLYWTGFNFQFPYLNGLWEALYYLIGPLIYLYVSAIFHSQNKKRYYFHFIPFALMLILLYYSNYLQLAPDFILTGIISKLPISMPIKLIHLIVYGVIIYQTMSGQFIKEQKINQWRTAILSFYALFILANIVYYFLVSHPNFTQKWDYYISFFMAIAMMGIYYFGWKEAFYLQFASDVNEKTLLGREAQLAAFMKKPNVIEMNLPVNKENAEPDNVKKYQSSALTPSISLAMKQKLEVLMTQNMLFKESSLRIQDLADELQISKHAISQVINENFGMGFYEYINHLRLEHALAIMQIPDNPYQVSEIAYLSGFNNKVSFYKMFKAKLGTTPTSYIEKFKTSNNEHKKI